MMQVNALISVAQEAGALQQELQRVQAELRAASQERHLSASAQQQRLQTELSAAIADTAAAKDRLQTVESELLRVQQQVRGTSLAPQWRPTLSQSLWTSPLNFLPVTHPDDGNCIIAHMESFFTSKTVVQAKKERADLQSRLARKDAELLELPRAPRTAWPTPVTELVAACEEAAASRTANELQAEAAEQTARIASERDEALSARQAADKQVLQLTQQVQEQQARAHQVQQESKAQVGTLQKRVVELSVQLLQRSDSQEHAEEAAQVAADQSHHAQALEAELVKVRGELAAARAHAVQALWDKEQHRAEHAHVQRVYSPAPTSVGADGSALGAAGNESAFCDSSGAATGALEDGGLARVASGDLSGYWKQCCEDAQQRVAAMEDEVSAMQRALNDERHAHELRNLSDSARRHEIAELQAQTGRSTVDVEYLKNALIGFFENGELKVCGPQVLLVLERLLYFTQNDKDRVGRLKERGALQRMPTRKGTRGTFAMFG